MINKKVVILALCTILLFVSTRACSDYFENRIREDIKNERKETTIKETNEYIEKYKDNWEMIINCYLRGLIKYEDMPFSDSFKKKHNENENMIKGECTGESADSYFEISEENPNNNMSICYKTGKGFEQIAYQLHYVINENNELDDIEILDSKVIENENGEFIEYDKYYLYNECNFVYGLLVRPIVNIPNYLLVNDNFKKKYPEYPKKGVLYKETYMIVEDLWQDENDKSICYAIVMDLQWTKTYKMVTALDDRGYVDDVVVSLDKIEPTLDPQYVQDVYDDGYS